LRDSLRGRVAIVTGAASLIGLGHAVARVLAEEGATVVVHDVVALDGSVGALKTSGLDASGFVSDLATEDGMVDLISFAVSRFGRLDVLVNNAGIGHLCGPLVDFSGDDWDAMFAINVRACFFGVKHAARQMIAQPVLDEAWGRGRIVNVASQAAKSGFALHGAYTATKHAVLGLTRAAAVELGPEGITVNAVCPNHMGTALGSRLNEMMAERKGITLKAYVEGMVSRVPLGRLGRPDDSAGVCGFLCSAAAAYVTGEAWNVSGGEEYH
jgi:meso-butanediol dehydrogenase/(S,S)-butanediol dehydrogenase/diacetyl reductase